MMKFNFPLQFHDISSESLFKERSHLEAFEVYQTTMQTTKRSVSFSNLSVFSSYWNQTQCGSFKFFLLYRFYLPRWIVLPKSVRPWEILVHLQVHRVHLQARLKALLIFHQAHHTRLQAYPAGLMTHTVLVRKKIAF
jgi:hypothetical protein